MGGRKKHRRRVLFAVGSPTGPRASGWCVSHTKDDVYLSPLGALAKVKKFSFHNSGICRDAFNRTPPTLDDRATAKWMKKLTPPAGSGIGTRVMALYFPTDYMSATWSDGAVTWVDPAPPGGVTIIELVYVRESREYLEAAFAEGTVRTLVGYFKLPGGESFAIVRSHGPWENRDLDMPASHGGSALLFSSEDPHGTGRPQRIQIRMPDDRDGSMALMELGGHTVPIGSKYVPGRGGLASSLDPF